MLDKILGIDPADIIVFTPIDSVQTTKGSILGYKNRCIITALLTVMVKALIVSPVAIPG